MSRFREAIESRTKLPLGAVAARNNLYQAMLRHYAGGELFLIPAAPQHEARLKNEITYLSKTGILRSRVVVTGIKEVALASHRHAVSWFEPRCIGVDAFDIRQAYFAKPIPITFAHHTVSYRHSLEQVFLPLLASKSLPCDSIVCSSTAARTAIAKLLEHVASDLPARSQQYKGRLDVIPFGVDTAEFRPIEQTRCRRKFDLPMEATILLFFGRVSASDKGDLLPLVIAFARVRKRVTNRRLLLVIAGNSRGSSSDHLKREIRERSISDSVRFIPHVTDAEKPFLYGAADVFVSPSDSIQECFGIVILEAMACGLPQVVSDWNGYRDLVVHGDTGFLVPTLWGECDEDIIKKGTMWPQEWELEHFQLGQSVCVDVKMLCDTLVEIANNRRLRLHMSARSRERAEVMFDWSKIVRRYEVLWEELNQIAFRLPDLRPMPASYRIPSYFSCFQHYSTANITDESLLLWDDANIDGLCETLATPYRGLFAPFDPFADWNLPAIAQIIKLAEGGIPVCELLERAARYGGRAEIIRQVMWLLKYGHVRV